MRASWIAGFVALALASTALAAGGPAIAPAAAPPPWTLIAGQANGGGRVEIEPLDGRLFIHRSTDGGGIPANGMIAIVDGGLLLVDTGWTEAQTEAILDWGRTRLRREWMGAVITHDHADRAGGVGALFRRHITVGALDLTAKTLAARGVQPVAALVTVHAPVFNDPRGFELFYPGRGHAPDNIVIAFPRSRVVFAGCLVKAAAAPELGFTGDADLAYWPAALGRIRERYPQMAIVPGHGALEPAATIQHTLDLLRARAR
jgi:glyoxylase-like metal-dependent hydrolase (beta-lactamase superfamily II)